MNEMDLIKVNENISYNAGKIYFRDGHNYTSKLMEQLLKEGYKTVKKGSVIMVKDPEGNELCSGYNRIDMLLNLAKTMR